MTDKCILMLLNSHLKEVQKVYKAENIFGIFVTDIQNNDISSEAVVIPSFDKVCTSFLPETNKLLNGKISVYDIRFMYQATAHGNPEFIDALYTEYIIINPLYQHLFDKLYKDNREQIYKGAKCGVPAQELQTALIKVCRMAWNESSPAVRFIKQLTDAEKIALKGIAEVIGDEGSFSQAKVASAVGVSRITMGNLVMKMKFYDVAIVEYHGNLGTYVKFIDDTLLDISACPINLN